MQLVKVVLRGGWIGIAVGKYPIKIRAYPAYVDEKLSLAADSAPLFQVAVSCVGTSPSEGVMVR